MCMLYSLRSISYCLMPNAYCLLPFAYPLKEKSPVPFQGRSGEKVHQKALPVGASLILTRIFCCGVGQRLGMAVVMAQKPLLWVP